MAGWCRRSPPAAISTISIPLIRRVMAEAGLGFGDLAGIAATGGPGLIGGVMVGVMTGKAIAAVARQALHRRQSSRGPCADGAPDP